MAYKMTNVFIVRFEIKQNQELLIILHYCYTAKYEDNNRNIYYEPALNFLEPYFLVWAV